MSDTVYDPATNPRYLQTVNDEPEIISNELWADLQTDLATANDILRTLDTPGWSHVAERINRQMADAERIMRSADSLPEINRAQGAIRACQWLLALREQIRREQQRLSQAIATSVPIDE